MKHVWKAAFEAGYWGTLGVIACVISLNALAFMTKYALKKNAKKDKPTDK